MLLLGMLWLVLTACDRSSSLDYDDEPEIRSIAWLKAQADGAATTLHTSLFCEAQVTANDAYGELYRRIVVEDATAALTIVINRSRLYRTYPIGTCLRIDGNGLVLCNYGGKLELGSGIGDEGYTTGLDDEAETAHLRATAAVEHRAPRTLRFDEVDASCVDCYVQLERVRFAEQGTWCDRDPESGDAITTERTLLDEEGNTLIVRTLGSAHYANEPLPEGIGSLCGVIDYFGGRYTLRVVNRAILF